jgi:KaiC/GvpD/RAD55 family RecA-like ATPase
MVDAVIEGLKERISVAIKVNQSVGIQVPENRHQDLLQALFSFMNTDKNEIWTFVTASNTYKNIAENFRKIFENKNIKFIDCISRSSGITTIDKECSYVESPTMLEKIILQIMNIFKNIEQDVEKFLVIDSLSSLVIYNDSEIVREFVSVLMNKARSHNIHIVTILIEEEVDTHKLLQMNDKIVVLRDSFIS